MLSPVSLTDYGIVKEEGAVKDGYYNDGSRTEIHQEVRGDKMKRDMDLIRQILLKIGESPKLFYIHPFEIDGYDNSQVTYHVMLLDEAGLIVARDVSSHDGEYWVPDRLTWTGHEFLEASRDNKRWEKAKSTILEKGGNIAFSLLEKVLIDLMTKTILGQSV
jgi:hypothetical protein